MTPETRPQHTAVPPNFYGLSRTALAGRLAEQGQPPYRADQIFAWVYGRRRRNAAGMSDLPATLRDRFEGLCQLDLPVVDSAHATRDGMTHKFVLRLADGARVESVSMRTEKRLTFCLSSQVGCALGCTFCATGLMGLLRNLTAAEIVAQVIAMGDHHRWQDERFNLVFMGMGEPLANYAPLVTSLRILTDAKLGIGYSPRRITVSTVGLVKGIERLGRENLKVNLAISLHAASDETRSRLMPVNRAWSLDKLMAAVRRYPLAPRQRVFFEYVLLDGVNDAPEDAQRLVRLLRDVKAKVNLIPFNDWPGSEFRRPPLARILAFQALLLDAGVTTTVRWSKGEDIGAACGQLKEAVA
jgi:23S rRNA (adenine2503-C2)-methyltransferase